jgi:glycerol kinase
MSASSGHPVIALRVDGGASENALMLELQADQLQVPVQRPTVRETTALGAAYLAGLAEGVWSNLNEVADQWTLDIEVQPRVDRDAADTAHGTWRRAVERSLDWARP